MEALHSKTLASFPILISADDGCLIYLPDPECSSDRADNIEAWKAICLTTQIKPDHPLEPTLRNPTGLAQRVDKTLGGWGGRILTYSDDLRN